MSSPTQKLNGWRLAATNALQRLQGKAIEAQAGQLGSEEANVLVTSIEQLFSRLIAIAAEEHNRIYYLPNEDQQAAFQHWEQLMVEPHRIKSLLLVVQRNLRAVANRLAGGDGDFNPVADANSVVTARAPSPTISNATYHTGHSDVTQSGSSYHSGRFYESESSHAAHHNDGSSHVSAVANAFINNEPPPIPPRRCLIGQGHMPSSASVPPVPPPRRRTVERVFPSSASLPQLIPPPDDYSFNHPWSLPPVPDFDNELFVERPDVTQLDHQPQNVRYMSSSSSVSEVIPQQVQAAPPIDNPKPDKPKVESKLPKIIIQKFDGRKEKYPEFIQSFKERIDSRTDITKLDKMYYLKQYLVGEAKAAIEGYSTSNENYDKCMQLLEREFGSNRDIVFRIRAALDKMPAPRDQSQSLTNFINDTCANLRRLEGLNHAGEGEFIIRKVVEKLPKSWRESYSDRFRYGTPTFTDFQYFLRDRLRLVREMNLTNEDRPTTAQKDTKKPWQSSSSAKPGSPKKDNSAVSNSDSVGQKKPNKVCAFCNQSHRSINCRTYATRAARIKALNNKCHLCFKEGHFAQTCESDRVCSKCSGHHHPALCPKFRSDHGLMAVSQPKQGTKRFMLTRTVKVRNPSKDSFIDAVVVFDTGAGKSYITNSFASRLSLKTLSKGPIQVHGFGGSVQTEMSRVVRFEIQTSVGNKEILAQTMKMIAEEPVDVPNSDSVAPQGIDILIGLNYFFDFIPVPTVQSGNETVIKTIVGDVSLFANANSAAADHTLLAINGFSEDDQLAWKAEYGDIRPIHSAEELQTLKFFDETTRKKDRYVVSLPFKKDTNSLPSNFGLAFGQLKSTVARLSPEELAAYHANMMNQIENKILEKAPHRPDGKVHVIPHHPVFKHSSATTQLRIVVNCSAKAAPDLPSLNECVHQGPDLLPQLIGILIRCRTRTYLISADVEKAFHQIELDEEDRDYVRILWLRDITKPCTLDNLVVLRFARVLFGLRSSPFLLNAVLRLHFNSSPGNEMVVQNTYVDNVFVFTDDKEFGVQEKFRLKDVLADAGMNLRSWFANDLEIESFFDESEKYAGESTKILGIGYDKSLDTFTFSVEIAEMNFAWTPARIIKAQLQVFDPLGLLLPAFVPIKSFLHKMAKLKVPMKKPLPPQYVTEWREILQNYVDPCSISIPRYVGQAESYELHVFSDASLSFVAACAYLRVKHPDGSYSATLLMAKNKVKEDLIRSVDDQKIPKLELVGIVLATEIMQKITEEIDVKFENRFLWSDSQIALAWIRKCPDIQFVARRLPSILKMHCRFGFVQSALNPADLPTRGCSPTQLRDNNQWFHGPEWLKLPEQDWPNPADQMNADIDVQFILLSKSVSDPSNPKTVNLDLSTSGLFDVSRYSSYTKAISVAKKVLTVAKKWLSKIGKSLSIYGNDKSDDRFLWSRSLLLLDEQKRFSSVLDSASKVDQRDGTYVFIDRFGNARGIKSLLPVLPKQSPLAALIVNHVHEMLKHAGVPQTLANVRKHVWILQGRRLVTHVVESCPTCRRYHAKPFRLPDYPDHPSERVNEAAPFKYSGLDFFGPMTLSCGDKRWCLLITCLVTRAIHLELVPDLTVLSFTQALTRFTSRRRIPTVIYSDNATTFRSASELFRVTTQVFPNDPHALNYFAQHQIDWRFLTERAPWKGGLYERLVGVVKSSFKKTVGRRSYDDDALRTIITELECAVNTRPLTYVDADALTPIRPCDFLGQVDPKPLVAAATEVDEEAESDPDWLPPAPARREELVRKLTTRNLQTETLWRNWSDQYLNALREKQAVNSRNPRSTTNRIPIIGEVVLVYDDQKPRQYWSLARIHELLPSADRKVRSASVVTSNGRIKSRPISHLYPLEIGECP